jgi:hypothetical protein
MGFALVAFGLAASAASADAAFVAERIDADNGARLIVEGPDAVGGIGDWALQNGTICAIVADPAHESDMATTGGGLVDLGLCGRADDQLMLYMELMNGSLAQPVLVKTVTPEATSDAAQLVTRGVSEGIEVETRYWMDRDEPRRLRITTRAERVGEGVALGSFTGALANVRSLSPFSVSLSGDGTSRGYTHPSYRGGGMGALAAAATAADLVVAVGAEELEPGIAYGQRFVSARLERPSEQTVPVEAFFFSDGFTTALTLFSRPFWLGGGPELGLLELLQVPLMDLEMGAVLLVEQELWVGERADAASVTNLLLPEAPLLTGRVDDARAVVHVERPGHGPLTQVRVDDEGGFAVRLPVGDYALRIEAPGARTREMSVTQEAAGTDLGSLAAGAPALVALPRGAPMRLVFVGVDGTTDPDFHADGRVWRMVGESDVLDRATKPERDVSLAGVATDPATVAVAPGRYRVLATRGPEFSIEEQVVDAIAGETVVVDLSPVRVIETPGWVSSDFHIHAAPSLDNPTAPERRVRSYVAQGAEVLVATEHENVFDFAPVIERLGLKARLPSLVGLEVTSEVRSDVAPYSMGHANVFPMVRDPLAYRRGAIANEGRRWRDVIAEVRALPGRRVVQLDHARFGDRELEPRAFLTHMGPAATPYDPGQPLDGGANAVLVERDPTTGVRDIDFDAIELLNGPYMASYERLREDWFSFLLQGEKIVGTANSDSHFLSDPVATPRNYVRVANDTPGGFDPEAFVDAILEGRMFGTTGPFIELALGDAGLGDTFSGSDGELRGVVRAASWVNAAELRVFVSGRLEQTVALEPGVPFAVPLHFERDAFVTTEVRGVSAEPFTTVSTGFEPFAFTNPIWVDADADGAWAPPGLPPATRD